MTQVVELRPIRKLVDKTFIIPSYQRGYRWTEREIGQLLSDLSDNISDKYCLQPLVVKWSEEKNAYIVIDGQQRLTTMALLLQYLGGNSLNDHIHRDREVNSQKSSIEDYYFGKAIEAIRNWRDKGGNGVKKVFTLDWLLDNVCFIFYPVDMHTDANGHALFANLNSGRIRLTNAELIKALLLQNIHGDDEAEREVSKRLLADEFDMIERAMRQDDFWYFIAGNREKPSSCISLLFDLVANLDSKDDGEFATFHHFEEQIKQKRNEALSEAFDKYIEIERVKERGKNKSVPVKDIWAEVLRAFNIISAWYSDSRWYNLIGYLRSTGVELKEIYRIYNEVPSKKDFLSRLKELCKRSITLKDSKEVSLAEVLEELNYIEHYKQLTNTLLLLNVATTEGMKFPFAKLHQEQWSLEHIHPQSKSEEGKEDGDFDVHSLGNMALLRSKDNSGFNNMDFKEKRKKIIDYYKRGNFIPQCTINVFMRFYIHNDKPPYRVDRWNKPEMDAYASQVKTIIINYVGDTKK